MTPQIKKDLSLFYIPKANNFDEYEIENMDNFIYFVYNLKIEDNNIVQIFLDEFDGILTFNYNDFISIKKSDRFLFLKHCYLERRNLY